MELDERYKCDGLWVRLALTDLRDKLVVNFNLLLEHVFHEIFHVYENFSLLVHCRISALLCEKNKLCV